MSTVLVVDDSAVDRRMVGGLLEKNPYLKIEYAEGAEQALEQLDQQPPDLVITDLVMPGMDGFDLVAAIRSRFAQIPVVLMTSHGSEEIAIRALKEGAASYVPKGLLNQDLLSTVDSVLAVARRRQGHEHLLENMTRTECSFVLTNDCSLIPPLVGYLQEHVAHLGLCDEAERIRVGVALEEALVNALYHGNLEVSSELYEADYKAYRQLVEERFKQSPYRDRRIFVEASISRSQARFVVRDEGPGFNPELLPDPTDPVNLEKCRGRGVLLMRTFMDDVTFNRAGNEVTMTKRSEVVMGGG
jgi:CheY-like chemotaxis protein/anti-sigma regulatory factor (Ser/Thr protein kinase)